MNIFNIGIAFLFVVGFCFMAYRYFSKIQIDSEKKKYLENKEFLKKANTIKSQLYFFYVDWCPHCKTAMNTWEKIQKDPTFSKFNVNFMTIDCENKKHKHLVSKFEIKEYPSYVLFAKNKKYIYDANLNSDSLNRFMTAVYEKM